MQTHTNHIRSVCTALFYHLEELFFYEIKQNRMIKYMLLNFSFFCPLYHVFNLILISAELEIQ